MQDFQFFVTDERYSVPSLMFVQTQDVAAARVLALRMLANRSYLAVEVRVDDVRVFTVDRDAAPAAKPRARRQFGPLRHPG